MSLASDSQNSSDAHIISGTAAKLKVVVARIYAQSWTDYREWSAKHSDELLTSLMTRQNGPLPPLPAQNGPLELTGTGWEITDHDAQKTYVLPSEDAIISELVPPYAPYESCTPATRNIMVGDDSDYLPFIPFADDPSYDWSFDLSEHKYVAWAEKDTSDLEVVLHETLRRLVADLGLAHADIDATRVLPMECRKIQKLSLIRDFPKWKTDSTKPPLAALNPRETVDYFLETFCSNLNCTQSFCNTHITVSPPNKVMPERLKPLRPCGSSCFLLSSETKTSLSSLDDISLILSAMSCSRAATPCDLAIICRLPCNQISTYWSSMPQSSVKQPVVDRSALKYKETSDVYVPQLPCKHEGPCNSSSGCSCFSVKAHCHTRCGCPPTCPRKWKGCTCAETSGASCSTKRCPCFKARIECDPEVCLPCEARDINSNKCQNVRIQRGRQKMTQVQESRLGLGLFILESCEKDELIAEYIGELVLYPTTISRDGIAIHRHRSYVFDINPEFSVDSGRAGNDTRYINHGSQPNCYTMVYLVNNEHRVGVFAGQRIEEGAELFIDYGPKFFRNHKGEKES